MEKIKIKGTDSNPEVILDKDKNEFKFSGRSIVEDVKEFYDPILEWIDEYTKDANEHTTVEFNMEYFNSSSSKQILAVLERFSALKEKGKGIHIRWNYLEYDEDMEEAGEAYSEIIPIPFDLISY